MICKVKTKSKTIIVVDTTEYKGDDAFKLNRVAEKLIERKEIGQFKNEFVSIEMYQL